MLRLHTENVSEDTLFKNLIEQFMKKFPFSVQKQKFNEIDKVQLSFERAQCRQGGGVLCFL